MAEKKRSRLIVIIIIVIILIIIFIIIIIISSSSVTLLSLCVRTVFFYDSKYVQILSKVIMEYLEIFEQYGIYQTLLPFGCFFDRPYFMFRGFKFLCRVVNTTPAADSCVGRTVVTCSTCSGCLHSYTN